MRLRTLSTEVRSNRRGTEGVSVQTQVGDPIGRPDCTVFHHNRTAVCTDVAVSNASHLRSGALPPATRQICSRSISSNRCRIPSSVSNRLARYSSLSVRLTTRVSLWVCCSTESSPLSSTARLASALNYSPSVSYATICRCWSITARMSSRSIGLHRSSSNGMSTTSIPGSTAVTITIRP